MCLQKTFSAYTVYSKILASLCELHAHVYVHVHVHVVLVRYSILAEDMR